MSKRDFRESLQTRVPDVSTREEIPRHRQCPLCHGRHGGVGKCDGTYKKASTFLRRYYKCNQCGHTWMVNFTPEQVKNDVEVSDS